MIKKDLLILSQLRNNARMSLTKMSKNIQVPVSTIFDRLKLNEKDIIIKHTSLIDFSKLGYNARANITIKVDKNDKEELKNYLSKHHSVNSLYRINNGFDFMVEGIFKHILELEEFIDNVEQKFNLIDYKSFFIIEDLKKECFMNNKNLIFTE